MRKIIVVLILIAIYIGGLLYKNKQNIANKAKTPPTMSQIRADKGTPVYSQEVSLKSFEKSVKISGKINRSGSIQAEVTYQTMSLIKVGDKAFVEKDGEKLIGKVKRIAKRAGLLSGLYEVTAEFQDLRNKEVESHFFVVDVVYDVLQNRIVIPRSAVSYREQGANVMIIGENRELKNRSVEVVDQNDDAVLIQNGLRQGELIVVSDQRYLNEGEVIFQKATEVK